MKRNRWFTVAVFAAFLLFALVPLLRSTSDVTTSGVNGKVVLYCAHDATYADSIIQRFRDETGVDVEVRYDEEANKSLGLTNLIKAEANEPRCDVFWNNQTLGTIRLQNAGLLQPYISPNAARFPDKFKDGMGHWTGFAARLRVYLLNTDLVVPTDTAADDILSGKSLQRVAIAKPQFGTTLSHYSVIAAELGMEGLQQWHRDLRERGVREVRGNSMTKDLVAEGICDLGFTDTDDAFQAIDAGSPVKMFPVVLQSGSTICLPNSVAMVKGSANPAAAKKLIDYLLSEEIELSLADSAARQIPLGTVDESRLSDEVKQLRDWATESADLTAAAEINQRVLDWLLSEQTGQ